jgi:probable HAF family extracellular repeat protein
MNARGDAVGYRQRNSDHMAAQTRGFLFSDSVLIDLGTFGGEDAVLTAVNDLGPTTQTAVPSSCNREEQPRTSARWAGG